MIYLRDRRQNAGQNFSGYVTCQLKHVITFVVGFPFTILTFATITHRILNAITTSFQSIVFFLDPSVFVSIQILVGWQILPRPDLFQVPTDENRPPRSGRSLHAAAKVDFLVAFQDSRGKNRVGFYSKLRTKTATSKQFFFWDIVTF